MAKHDEDREVDIPEPFNVIFSPALYHKIKHNQATAIRDEDVPQEELEEFKKFRELFKEFLNKLNKQDHSSLSILSALMSMWGYTRKYCGMCGRPIIGKPGHIQNRLVCYTCYDSYKITEELFKRVDKKEEENKGKDHTDHKKSDNSSENDTQHNKK